MRRTAQWFADHLHYAGLSSEIIETTGHPLVYGHYDVQPPDPLELWKTPPFEPTVRDGNVFARGATDDKGQALTHVFAAETFLQSVAAPPFQLKFVIEGEEEIGSKGIGEFLHTEIGKKKLACDCIVVSDSQMFAPGEPAITYGLRGITAFELFLTGPNRDLHSGTFGGSVFNPAIALTQILSQFVNENGVVKIPHFYDDVLPLTERESNQIALLPFDEEEFCAKLGITKGFGEAGFSTMERRWTRPTFDINGVTAGYQGEGSKTIIPSKASAKFTFRLVPNQDPKKIEKSVRDFIAELIPPGIAWQLDDQHGA
jgi:succinyl-diaminopimelate desuccinylase